MHRLISVPGVRGEVRSSPPEQQTVAEPHSRAANISRPTSDEDNPPRPSPHPFPQRTLTPPSATSRMRIKTRHTCLASEHLKDLSWEALGGRERKKEGEKENGEQMCVCVCVGGGEVTASNS